MLKKYIKSINRVISCLERSKGDLLKCKQVEPSNNDFVSIQQYRSIIFKSKYNFARKVSPIVKPITDPQQRSPNQQKTSQHHADTVQVKPKQAYFKATQNYTFTDLDKDLETYQQFLTLFNTHTKKAHPKLLNNQLKIIECIINAKRDDLINKFLSTNYRNRLANPQTLTLITNYCLKKMQTQLESIVNSPANCQSLLQNITLLTQLNQTEPFNVFSQQINKINPEILKGQTYLLNLLKLLPSAQCQFLTVYIFLFREKQLPLYLMKSQFFGIHTENLKFHNLGQTFYQIRKFVRRYFALYSKKLQNYQTNSSNSNHNLQRQTHKQSKDSSLQTDVACFLKSLNYTNVKKQVEIDGFVLDFLIQGVKPKSKNHKSFLNSAKQGKQQQKQPKEPQIQQKGESLSTILQVMGSYHYTAKGLLKGRDIRKLILLSSPYREKRYNVKLIHFDDFNKSRGFRNKMELIRWVLQESGEGVNWEATNKGYDSQWQLKEHYEEFK